MLLFLMLAVAVLTITMLGVARSYKRAVQRDREVEMIHRGEQYERAVRRFYIKNSRYPVSLEQLENMNKIRYLRKRYKDPMSPDGQWKIVHPADFNMSGAVTQPVAGAAAGSNQTSAGNTSQPTQDAGSSSTVGNQGTNAGSPTGTGAGTATGDTGTTGNNSGSAFGNSSGTGTSAFGNSGSGTGGGAGAPAQGVFGNSPGGNNAANGAVLGGGDVYGVVSKSKKEGFHIYGEKGKYNEWFFIYNPTMDKGQLLVGPYNPKMFIGSAGSGLNSGTGAPGSGTPGSGLGGSGLGGSGLGSSPGTSNAFGGSPTPTPTPQPPSQPAQPNQ